MTPTDDGKPKRVRARRVRTRMPTTAAALAATTVTLAVLLVVFSVMVATGASPGLSLAVGGFVGLAAGTWFFLTWRRRDPKRRPKR